MGVEFLFPSRCPVCDRLLEVGDIREKRRIHKACESRLYSVKEPVCFHCGKPLADETKEYCYECEKQIKKTRQPHWRGEPYSYITQGKALFLYRKEAQQMMYRFKYSNRREYAQYFADEAYRRYGEWIKERQIDVVIPVPMFRRKERYRGYNQAKIFAKALAKKVEIAYEPSGVRRLRDTCPQKGLDSKERKNNLKNAFQAEKFVVKYKKVLLVDDIYTTGNTIESVAGELCRIGVPKVYFLAVCIGTDT